MNLMIVLLLSCLFSYVKANDYVNVFTGYNYKSITTDTTKVAIEIYRLKQANVKMIERNYLLQINNEQDSIIKMKDKYINEQQNVIIDFQKRVELTNKLNQAVKQDLDKQKIKTKIIGGVAGAVIAGLIVGILIN